jgi:hypothetical protein
MDGNVPNSSQKLIMYTSTFDKVWNPVKLGKQLSTTVALEDIATKKKTTVEALVDSGYARTCIDEEFARTQGWLLEKIHNPIPVEYTDRTVTKKSRIHYLVNLRIRAAGRTVLMGVLVMCLKSFKIFLGFDWLQAINPRVNWRTQSIKIPDQEETLLIRRIEEKPRYQELFLRVFLEEAFKELPPHWKWDHAIELVEGSRPLKGR